MTACLYGLSNLFYSKAAFWVQPKSIPYLLSGVSPSRLKVCQAAALTADHFPSHSRSTQDQLAQPALRFVSMKAAT